MDLSSPDTWRWIFLFVAVVCTVGEIALAGTFFLLPFAAGALVASLAGFAGAAVGLEWLLFVAVSAASSAVLWPLRRRLDARNPRAEIGANRWAGRQAYVLREIPGPGGQTGLVRLYREEWRAESLLGIPISVGSTVLVSRVDGTRLMVIPLDEQYSLPPTANEKE